MNFHQGPVTKYLHLGPVTNFSSLVAATAPGDFCYQPYPLNPAGYAGILAFPNGVIEDADTASTFSGGVAGRVVTVFLDTPFWPAATKEVNIKIVGAGINAGTNKPPVLIASNVVIKNYATDSTANDQRPYYTFLRGTSVLPGGRLYNHLTGVLVDSGHFWMDINDGFNTAVAFSTGKGGALSTGEIRLCYSGALQDIKPAGARVGLAMGSWVTPTDTIQLTPTSTTVLPAESNLAKFNRLATYDLGGATSNNPHPIITALKLNSNLSDWSIEFSALIDNSQNSDPSNLRYPYWTGSGRVDNFSTVNPAVDACAVNEIYFTINNNGGGNYVVKGLAKDSLKCTVVGRDVAGNIVFTGTLAGAANLTYFRNNSPALIADYLNPTTHVHMTPGEFKVGAKPNLVCNTTAMLADNNQICTLRSEESPHGTQPIRVVSIIDPSTAAAGFNVLAITVVPV